MNQTLPEPWLRGPIPGISASLLPVAHAFLLAKEDVDQAVAALTHEQLWLMPAGVASIGYHLGHLAGSTDRLLTYARGEKLSTEQMASLTAERLLCEACPGLATLLANWHAQIDEVMTQLHNTSDGSLTDRREVGRAKLPSTVLGLLYHAGEHASRHTGQIVTTSRIVRGGVS